MFSFANNSISVAGYLALLELSKFFSNIERSLNEFLNPFMANLKGPASYPASYLVKMEGHIFHYSEKFLNNLSFKNERQSIRHYEVLTYFLKSPHLGPQTRQNFI